MSPETLEDHLRRATRSFTARLPEDEALALGRELALELARAHGETPPRHPAPRAPPRPPRAPAVPPLPRRRLPQRRAGRGARNRFTRRDLGGGGGRHRRL